MAVTGTRDTVIVFSADLVATVHADAVVNANSPAQVSIITLASGDNTLTPPASGTVAVACTIIPPLANTATMTLKGISGDTGVVLHKTDPTSLGLNSPTAPFILTASASIVGVRVVWT